MQETAEILHEEFTQYGYKITTKKMGHCMFSLACFFDSSMGQLKAVEGKQVEVKTHKLQKALGQEIEFIDLKKTIVEAGYEVIKRGHVKDLTQKKKKGK